MWISKTGAVKALKEAWKKGYEIMPMGEYILICSENWALEAKMIDLPLEVSQALVEHYGGIPTKAAFVKKGSDNQFMVCGGEDDRKEDLALQQENALYMHRAPVTFRTNWELFVTAEGEWLCVDNRHLDILEDIGWCSTMISDNQTAIFACNGGRLTIAPGRFGAEDTKN